MTFWRHFARFPIILGAKCVEHLVLLLSLLQMGHEKKYSKKQTYQYKNTNTAFWTEWLGSKKISLILQDLWFHNGSHIVPTTKPVSNN